MTSAVFSPMFGDLCPVSDCIQTAYLLLVQLKAEGGLNFLDEHLYG